jgi:hypothetical protein
MDRIPNGFVPLVNFEQFMFLGAHNLTKPDLCLEQIETDWNSQVKILLYSSTVLTII